MKLRAPEYIIMFLIFMVTCSTYYLHWTHGPEIHDHEKYRFRKQADEQSPITPELPKTLRKQPDLDSITVPKTLQKQKPRTIAVAVPTHNRIGYVQLTSAALKGTFPVEDVWIFDDTSSEYSTQDLIGWYGTEHIWQSTKRMKADAMARHILEWFLSTKYDVLVLLDSDLLVSPNWLAELQLGLQHSHGLMSLYRSAAPKHKSLSCGDVLCQQPSMGNAGTVWRRDLAKRMLTEMSARDGGFDWGWSEWCTKNKVPMEALKKSAVLHIGMYGSWSHESTAEKSVGFPMGELSTEVRERAEIFLKGAKPIEQPNVVPTWQSYITSTKTSQNTIKTAAYDSRNIWVEPDTCNHATSIPERPTALFDKWSAKVCSKYSEACSLFKKAFVDTWDNGITWLKDGTVFLVTGDIPLMWLRDSSAQVTHYLALAEHSSIQRLIEGVLRRQMKWIELDVYGSAFRMFLDFDHVGKKRLTDWDFKCGRTIHVAQHDYEMDSAAYVVRLAYLYWKKTGRTCWMQNVQQTWHRIVDMWILEQDHSKSTYTYPTLENNGKGTPVCKTGMSWAGMRPSDDKMKYHYNIPGQLFAAKALEYIEEMSSLWSDDVLKQKASKLRREIIKGVEKYGVVDGVLVYETDGCGHHLMADDANIPSLLSLPYLDIHIPEYEKTRLNILSDKNPWWSEGGIGSPHTNGRGHPWHLAMIMEGWKDQSTLERVLKTAYGGSLHESVTMTGGSTRRWFGWANALFSEWLMQTSDKTPLKTYKKTARNHYFNGLSASSTAKLEYDALKRLESISSPCQHYRFPKAIQLEGATLTTTSIGTSLHLASDEQKEAILNVDEQVNCILTHLKQAKVRHLDIKCGNMGVENGILKMLDFDISSMDHNPLSLVLKKMDDEFMDDAKYEAFVIQKFNTCINERKNTPKVRVKRPEVPTTCSLMQWKSENDCFVNKVTGAITCTIDGLGFDAGAVSVSKGGELPSEVRGRAESFEFPKYGAKTWFVKQQSKLDLIVDGVSTNTFKCDQIIHGHTYFIKRVEYANVWHTMLDWFAFWETSTRMGAPDNIIWLDGHARGHLDDVWNVLFGVKPKYMSSFNNQLVCFEQATFVYGKWHNNAQNSIYPIAHKTHENSCRLQMSNFVQYFLKQYDITNTGTKKDTIIIRKPYDAHPRVGLKIDRTIFNLEQVKTSWPNAQIVDLASKTFRQQLEIIVNTSVLRAVHGAALTFLIFVTGDVIEWMPTTHYNVVMFESLSSWTSSVAFSRKVIKSAGNKAWIIPVSDTQNKKTNVKIFKYHKFKFEEPHFLREKDRQEMLNHKDIVDIMNVSPEKLYGEIRIVKNGKYDETDDCGYRADYSKHIASSNLKYKQLIPLLVPGGNSFQHFLDGSMPKLIQAYEFIKKHPKAKILTKTSAIVNKLIRKLGITNDILEYSSSKSYTAEELFLICKTPPVHPDLWEKSRNIFNIDKNKNGSKIIWIDRNGQNSRNGGRLILNQKEITDELSRMYPDNFVMYDSHDYTLDETIELFNDAAVIMGAHGGGLYNLIFAPSNTLVIEFMPVSQPSTGIGIPLGPAPNIIWMQSDILKQRFWRVSTTPVHGTNFNVNLKDIVSIFDNARDIKPAISITYVIPSIVRTPETLCTTIESILAATKLGKILVHRRGDYKCAYFNNPRVSIKYFKSHRTTNDNQKKDYMQLFEDAKTVESKYVMFLDDDVRFCKGIENTLVMAQKYEFVLGHFGRGGSGIIVPTEKVDSLMQFVNMKDDNVDVSMLIWALRYRKECSLRPQKIQMEHIGKISSIDRRPRGGGLNIQWHDHDTCGAPANNHDFQAMSETPSEHFWSEYCIHSHCAPFGSTDNCKTCLDGYKGDDCGIPDDGYEYKRKPNAAPIVLLSSSVINSSPYINLHIIGEQLVNKDVAYNVWHRKESAQDVWSQTSKLAFPIETRVINSVLSEPELWILKYYEKGSQRTNKISRTAIDPKIISKISQWPRGIRFAQDARQHGHTYVFDNKWFKLLDTLIPSGSVSLDIGAMIGDTLFPINMATNGKTIAFEMGPVPFSMLAYQKELNPNLDIDIYNVAITTKYETVKYNTGCGGCNGGIDNNKGVDVNAVPLIPFLISKYGENILTRISFIKIDTEGHDIVILKSNRVYIKKYKPILWIEWFAKYHTGPEDKCSEESAALFDVIKDLGYEPRTPDNNAFSGRPYCKNSNYVRDILLLPINRISQTVVSNDIVKTSDLFAAIDYNARENSGPWKQGWDYEYDGRFNDGLTVHVVPHSHNDPGWIKTYHTYYSTQTKHILDTVVAALTEDPRRTFIWAEISYFSLWWDDASQQQKEQAKKLVAEKRLDFVTGGWVMNDEASVTARATRWHLQEGREWLQNTFGVTPQYSWAIDPFGHSAGQAQVLKELGYKGMLIQRVHYAVKKQLAQKQQLEFRWQTPAGEIFTHMMPFYSYDGPHTCGPDPSVCCQFDFARISGYGGCPWHKPSVPITDSNVAERSKLWLDQVYKKAMLYRGKHVLVPVGDDFRYQTMDEAHKQFTNYQKMFDWIKVNVPSVSISFSTLSRYFDAVVQTQVPKLQGSFFPYSDRVQDYWTGYFNSRIFYKGYDRLLESLIAAVETKCPTVDIHLQKRALGIFQHHDGITGTAKSHVVQDYYKTMQNAVIELKSKLKTCLNTNTLTMGMAVNLPLLNITTFLDSLRSSGLMQPPNKVVLFSDKWTVQALSHKYSEVNWVLNNNNSNGFHPSNYRYYQYYSHILSSKPYTNMLIADVRDTYIMSNPFKTITEPDFVHVFLEENGHFLNSGDFNTIWIRKCYTNDMIKKIGSRPVSCSGVVLGGWEKMKEYLKLMTSELDSHRFCESNGIDQGIHNVLVYNKRQDLFKIHKNGGIVLTMGYMAKNNKILDSMAKSSILHQYDRHFLANQWILEDIKSKASIIYYNNGCNKNWLKTMGYTGECVQHDSIMESFERLHYDYKVTEKTPNCLAGQRNAILLVSSGHSVAKQFVDCFKKVYLLDWFGTSKDMTPRGVILLNAMRKGIGQFLGYTLLPPPKDTGVKPRRQAYGILLGKLPRYWVQKKHLLSKMPDVKFACVTCDIEMKNVVNHKRLPRGEYIKLTSEATFLLGAGHPIGSPSVLEALQCGLTIILPKMQHYKMGVTHATQHDDIHAIMNEQPEVRKRICYYENDEKMVECVRSAQKYPPLTLISYTRESFDMRMKTFFGQTNANGHILVNPLSIDTPTMKADEIRPYEEDVCVPTAGLQFVSIKIDDHGRLLQINDTPVHESLVWRSNNPGQGVAGAYLMSVTSKEDILKPIKHTMCIAKMYKQVETTFDMLKRRIRVYKDGTIEFIYDVDIHARNNGELWAVYKPEWTVERLCSDVHGLTWECHVERKDAPLQAKFWPMPTMAWLASSSKRMTFTGAQPTGVGFHEGAMILMLDRRGNQDDARGLGQGITDSRPVEMRFGVLMETEGLKERATEKALLIRNWMLNPSIELV